MQNPDTPGLILEACVETFEQAVLAERSGADRIELCADLSVGGLTPSNELIEAVVAKLKIPVMVMIRPRGGDFVYSDEELALMKRSVAFCKIAGVKGVVFGFLTPKNEIDVEKTKEFSQLSQPLQVTFHKAIDETPDLVEATKILTQIPGIQRILTSGGATTALEGKEILKKMIAAGEGSVTILTAGKVTTENLSEVHRETGGREYHGKRIVF